MIEAIEVLIFIETLLASISGSTGVYRGVAPPDATPPYIVIAWQGGTDIGDVNAHRLLNNSLYQVAAEGFQAQNATLVSMAYAIDAALQRAAGTTTNGRILMIDRERPLVMDSVNAGVIYSRIGGIYRAFSNALSV